MAKRMDIFKAVKSIYEEKLKHLTLYTEQEIRQLAIENRWNGEGIKDEPYIVESADGFDQEIRIKKPKTYLYFKNLDLQYIMFDYCDGFILENCNFERLVLSSCKNFEIRGCSVGEFGMEDSNRNHLKNCTINNISTFIFSHKNTFEDCTVKKNDAIIKRTMLITSIARLIPFTILALGLALFYLVMDTIFFSDKFEVYNLVGIILIGIIFIFGLVTWVIVLLRKKHPPPLNRILSDKI